MAVYLGQDMVTPVGGFADSDGPVFGDKTITQNGTYHASDDGYDGYESVTVDVRAEVVYDTPTIEVSSGGLITASANGKSSTSQLSTQAAKTVAPSETEQTAVASGKYTTGDVKVGAISSTYVGSGITRRTADDLTVDGPNVTAPAGYYDTEQSTAVATGSVTVNTPTVSSSGLITASASVTPGYVGGVPQSKTLQLSVQASKTITPNGSQQTAIPSGTYATGNVIVSAVPTETKTVSENGSYQPTSGKYFSSFTVNIPIQHYYTGSTDPSSSLGANGDIYLKA